MNDSLLYEQLEHVEQHLNSHSNYLSNENKDDIIYLQKNEFENKKIQKNILDYDVINGNKNDKFDYDMDALYKKAQLQVVIDSDENLLINDGGMSSLMEFKSPLDIKKIDSLKYIY